MDSFSNRDKDVFLITCEKMIDRGALMSRYSRTRELDLRTLWDKEFAEVPDRAEKFYERVFLEYGDESVAELATAQVGIQNVSNVLSKIIEESRIGLSYLEKSSRYVSYKEKRNGRYLYLDPDRANIPSRFQQRYVEFNDSLFELYEKILAGVSNYIREHNSFENTKFFLPSGKEVRPGEDNTTEEILKKAYDSSVRSRALDETRFILPASTLTNIGISGNARAFSHMLERLSASRLREAESLYSELLRELKLVFPKLIDNVENPHGLESVEYLKSIKSFIPEVIMTGSPVTRSVVKLMSWDRDERALNRVISSHYFERTEGDYESLYGTISLLSVPKKKEMLDKIVSLRSNRRNKLDRSFEHVHYTFEINTNFGAFRDLQRHRTMTIQRKMLSPDYGHDMPPILSKIDDLSREYVGALDEAKRLYKEIYAEDKNAAQYVIVFAHKHPTIVTMSLRELVYFTEIRSTPQAHFDLRNISREMVRLATEVNPSFQGAFKFLNKNEEELGRLSAELRKEIRLKNA
ncbi:MAG: FAD-dependent thymidylate synthase [Thermoplasmatales archaeon]|jgi:thymidylate synthase ThyX|nr:FAD-dependent thymidylate synthase [Candidatus Thermoplasmatota archaeon]MDA8055174.1 FAD-dependent thymidylate synthase [Thermoplasmatales archaeon]